MLCETTDMRHKSIAKPKRKISHLPVAKFGKKAGDAKTKVNKTSKTYTLDSKQKTKSIYSRSSAHMYHELHDAAPVIEVATPCYLQTANRQTEETEVAKADNDVNEL